MSTETQIIGAVAAFVAVALLLATFFTVEQSTTAIEADQTVRVPETRGRSTGSSEVSGNGGSSGRA